jgi:hypothetical protein
LWILLLGRGRVWSILAHDAPQIGDLVGARRAVPFEGWNSNREHTTVLSTLLLHPMILDFRIELAACAVD